MSPFCNEIRFASLPIVRLLLLAAFSPICMAGCSNEVMNSAMYSRDARIRKFREYQDREIGRPYLGIEEEACSRLTCTYRPDGMLEITNENTFEEGCTIVWIVEPSESKKYRHPTNNLELDLIGIRRSWRYASDPEKCLFGLDWEGPW